MLAEEALDEPQATQDRKSALNEQLSMLYERAIELVTRIGTTMQAQAASTVLYFSEVAYLL